MHLFAGESLSSQHQYWTPRKSVMRPTPRAMKEQVTQRNIVFYNLNATRNEDVTPQSIGEHRSGPVVRERR